MKLAVMQPYFFPYLGYFQLIKSVDKIILYSIVIYIRNGWINRNRILEVNRKPIYFGIPIKNKSSLSLIADVGIDNKTNWKNKILKQLSSNYARSTFFEEVYPLIENIFVYDTDYLFDFNYKSIIALSEYLDIDTEIETDNTKYEDLENDLRSGDSDIMKYYLKEKNIIDRKTIRILNICEKENANIYNNPIGGQELYKKEDLAKCGIDLKFINTLPYSYKQRSNEFFPNLSIIDVLFNCGKEGTKELLNNYTLI